MNRRDLLKHVGATGAAAAIATHMRPARAMWPLLGGASASSSGHPLGINTDTPSYFSGEIPFLNILKQAGSNSFFSPWATSTTAFGGSTGEEAYFLSQQCDSDGYPTSVNGSAIGRTYTRVNTAVFVNIATVSGYSAYPIGPYTLACVGAGTLTLGADVDLTTLATSSTGVTVNTSTGVITSTSTSGTWTVTFSLKSGAPSTAGIRLDVSATDPSSTGNYLRSMAMVPSSQYSDYLGGATFSPQFLALINGTHSIRFMKWTQLDAVGPQTPIFNSTPTASVNGATSCTLSTPWSGPQRTANAYFWDSTACLRRQITFQPGSAGISWTGAITNSPGTNAIYFSTYAPWSERALPSNFSWATDKGVPLEIQIALCNQLNADMHTCLPMDADSSYITSFHQLVYSGTGAQAPYGKLNAPLKLRPEISNEVWNSAYPVFLFCALYASWVMNSGFGFNVSPSSQIARYNGYAYQCSGAASIAQTVWGSDFNRCIPVLGAQAATITPMQGYAGATGWAGSPLTNYPIKEVVIAPYVFDVTPVSAADVNTMLAQADGGLTYFFNCFTTNNMGSGVILSSIPSGGWLSTAQSWVSAYSGHLPVTSSGQTTLGCYEAGLQFFPSTNPNINGTTLTAWENLVTAAQSDSRMKGVLEQYYATWFGDYPNGMMHFFVDTAGPYEGSWLGLVQSVMETPSVEPKYQAWKEYL